MTAEEAVDSTNDPGTAGGQPRLDAVISGLKWDEVFSWVTDSWRDGRG